MATKIQVTPEGVRRTAREMDADLLRFRDSYRNVYRASDEMKGHWQGKDNTAYCERIEEYKKVFTDMEEIIDEYISFLERSASEYRGTLDDVTAAAKSF